MCVYVDVDIGRGQIGGAEPHPDHVTLDARLQKVNCGGVPEDVRADPTSGARVIEACSVAPHDLVDAETREWLAVCRKDRRPRRWWWMYRLEQRRQKRRRLMPERACAPLVALAVQAHKWVLTEIEVFNTQIGGLLSARSGVVEEEDEGPVPQSETAVAR